MWSSTVARLRGEPGGIQVGVESPPRSPPDWREAARLLTEALASEFGRGYVGQPATRPS